ERFTGIEVLTFCLMDNHFHLLLKVDPEKKYVSEKELLQRIEALYGKAFADETKKKWGEEKAQGHDAWVKQQQQVYLDRMQDLSGFMKELKQRFTQWFNKRKDRRGPLWEDRFKSVLVEGSDQALMTIANYIDLNPVRGGLADDPKDYRWCGYGAATGGDPDARNGLLELMQILQRAKTWKIAAEKYRLCLFADGKDTPERKGFDPDQVRDVIEKNGTLSSFEILRCRVRYFSDGVALGSRTFVEQIFEEHRKLFSEKRSEGRRAMRCGGWEGLQTMRALRGGALEVEP
ncbi:MAG: chemotaxis protein CheW, partial [Verrucomicrobiota bacterium]